MEIELNLVKIMLKDSKGRRRGVNFVFIWVDFFLQKWTEQNVLINYMKKMTKRKHCIM